MPGFFCLFVHFPLYHVRNQRAKHLPDVHMLSLTCKQKSKYGELMTKEAQVIKHPLDFIFPKPAA